MNARPSWHLRPTVLLLVLALAGCSGQGGDPTSSASTTATSEPTDTTTTTTTTTSTTLPCVGCGPGNQTSHRTAAFLKCSAVYNGVVADHDKLQAALPDGYTVDGDTPVVTIGAEYEVCESLVLDNTTVIKPVSFLAVQFLVVPPKGLESSHDDAYILEWNLSNATAVAWFKAAGFNARLATFTVTSSPTEEVLQVSSEGVQYEFHMANLRTNDGSLVVLEDRNHSMGPSGPCYADERAPQTQNQSQGAVTGTATGGALGAVVPGGQLLGSSGLVTPELFFQFTCAKS